ncbi:beta-ketoacyl-ACP synthase 3 [Verrucomicrobiota bacterium]
MNKKLLDALQTCYRSMVASRAVDQIQAAAAQRGEVKFYMPCSGHEGLAAMTPHLIEADWLHCHYRDRALAFARGVSCETVMHGLFGNAESNSGGRRMPAFPSNSSLNILSTPTLVGYSGLQAAGVASVIKDQPKKPLVVCSVGEGATQQGDFYEAVAEAVRSNLPVLFVIEDNNYALSTPSAGRNFYNHGRGNDDAFYGLTVQHVDGSDPLAVHEKTGELIKEIRQTRGPQILVMNVARLESHTNADDHTAYRSAQDIESMWETADPVANLRAKLIELGATDDELKALEDEVTIQAENAFQTAKNKGTAPEPEYSAKKALPESLTDKKEYRGADDDRSLSMLEAMRNTLRERLGSDENVTLFGQDIEDPKGDVFGLTRGLSTDFPNQVNNAPLAENSIIGLSIGQALAGRRPVAMMQFADFMPVAYSQILSELGSMHWRTKGDWNCPVIVMAICGGYRAGLGPFHAQTNEATMAHIPGVDVYMPSNAADAAGMLNAAFESGRPSVFFYPKALINQRENMTSADVANQIVPVGKARVARPGNDLTLISWGSTMPICEEVADTLAESDFFAEVIDLRTIFPWDVETVLQSARKTGRAIVVHEDNMTCGMGGEVLATIAEKTGGSVKLARVTRPDTYVPYEFPTHKQVLPSFQRVLGSSCELLDLDLHWEKGSEKSESGEAVINAIGSSPTDETLVITDLYFKVGDQIAEGDTIATVEADKAAVDISAPFGGTVTELCAKEGDTVTVGEPLMKLMAEAGTNISEDDIGTPVIKARETHEVAAAEVQVVQEAAPVQISSITTALGSRKISNEELLKDVEGWKPEDVVKRTGIANRYWIDEGEDAISLATKAATELLEVENLQIGDIDAIICSTGTPPAMTPSVACSVLHNLSPEKGEVLMQAHDVSAACSGYLYALQQAYDVLRDNPAAKVMVLTTETLSPVLNQDDPNTLILFGDAATASLVSCEKRPGNIQATVQRPVLSAKGEVAETLYVPLQKSDEFVLMDGKPVFKLAVRKMIDMLDQACAKSALKLDDLVHIVPHQANERIIEAIRKNLKLEMGIVFSHIQKYGNTSSNTIPIALAEVMPQIEAGSHIGLAAFGGGFTFGAGIIQKV